MLLLRREADNQVYATSSHRPVRETTTQEAPLFLSPGTSQRIVRRLDLVIGPPPLKSNILLQQLSVHLPLLTDVSALVQFEAELRLPASSERV